MPNADNRPNRATFNFLSRSVASGAFLDEFRGEKFDENFQNYYGSSAMPENHRKAVNVITSCDACLSGLDHMHEHLHDHGIVAKWCEDTDARRRPYAYWWDLSLGLTLFAISVAVLLPPLGLWPFSETPLLNPAGGLLGIAGAVWLLLRSRYSGL